MVSDKECTDFRADLHPNDSTSLSLPKERGLGEVMCGSVENLKINSRIGKNF